MVYNEAMPFSHEILLEACAQAKGRCECQREGHDHHGPCGKSLLWTQQGSESASGGRSAIRRPSWATDTLVNCQILCVECQGARVKPVE